MDNVYKIKDLMQISNIDHGYVVLNDLKWSLIEKDMRRKNFQNE